MELMKFFDQISQRLGRELTEGEKDIIQTGFTIYCELASKLREDGIDDVRRRNSLFMYDFSYMLIKLER